MSWMWWLSAPVFATVLTAVWSWLRARPRPERTTRQSVADHAEYLDALARQPRAGDRGPHATDR